MQSQIIDAGEDHPRVCGEQAPPRYFGQAHKGSPPRVRGTADQDSDIPDEDRITPACAGNSITRLYIHKDTTDHPRVCGEQA